MNRRHFLTLTAAGLAAGTLPRHLALGAPASAAAPTDTDAALTGRFDAVLRGFLRNAKATSRDYTLCDFPGGTKLGSCCAPNGKTYTSVARMLPALAEYIAGGHERMVAGVDVAEVVASIYRTAFDPKHPDYWGEPAGNKPTQRTVESSLAALALVRLGPDFVARLTPVQRAQINRWLASCTKVPERTNNHAWFTAVNQAARLRLGRTFPEFKGDEAWMIDDLKAMDVLAQNAADGWYSDDPKLTVYDYYNFWTFGNFPLFWSRIAGELYPEWDGRLRARAREFLQRTPYFFGADGAVPLFGRSLIYRWALLSPLLLGYQQGLWPHSPGLLRRIVARNFGWWWNLGAYDEQAGKLRETLSPDGTRDVREAYIDNGHPYWAMQGCSFLSIPASDPFWTAPEEPLPVEKGDFVIRISGPRMLLTGTQASGEVRWVQAKNTPRRDYYRDKYNKFVWSSAFAFNVLTATKDIGPWDQALVFRDPRTSAGASRIFPDDGELLEDGVRTTWTAKLGGRAIRVISTVRLAGSFELRTHDVQFGPVADASQGRGTLVDTIEGSYALGLGTQEEPEFHRAANWASLKAVGSGRVLVSWAVEGHDTLDVARAFGPQKEERVNLVHPRTAVLSLRKQIDLAKTPRIRLVSLHYASTKPAPMPEIHRRAAELLRAWTPV